MVCGHWEAQMPEVPPLKLWPRPQARPGTEVGYVSRASQGSPDTWGLWLRGKAVPQGNRWDTCPLSEGTQILGAVQCRVGSWLWGNPQCATPASSKMSANACWAFCRKTESLVHIASCRKGSPSSYWAACLEWGLWTLGCAHHRE